MAARCRFVVVTGGATEVLRARCLSPGADAVFDKAGEFEPSRAYCRAAPRAAQMRRVTRASDWRACDAAVTAKANRASFYAEGAG